MFVSIIIPTLNEEKSIVRLLHQLQPYREQGHEVFVVDGGSIDKTVSISESLTDKVILSDSGRANQMNNGAAQANNNILWFLHADTIISNSSIEYVLLAKNKVDWGRFNVKLSGENILFRLIEKMINVRSCLTGIATGDQAIFINKAIYDSVQGFSNIPLMEDVDLSKKLNKISKPYCVKNKIITSSRRWEKHGIINTTLLMWKLRFLFWLGVSAEKLALQYK